MGKSGATGFVWDSSNEDRVGQYIIISMMEHIAAIFAESSTEIYPNLHFYQSKLETSIICFILPIISIKVH